MRNANHKIDNKLSSLKKEEQLAFRTVIDLFAGCGDLSLGLYQTGWNSLFAIEKSVFAFETPVFSRSLIGMRSRNISQESRCSSCKRLVIPKLAMPFYLFC